MTTLRDYIDDAIVDPPQHGSIVKPFVMSHGTLECRNLYRSRKFYEEFLGLECVVHSPSSIVIRLGVKFYITAVEVGDDIHESPVMTHWGLDVATKEEVDEAYQNVLKYRDQYGLGDATEPVMRHGIYAFYFQDIDSNWWEIQYYPGYIHDDVFDFGDRYQLQPPVN